jgi:hypothetical protein
MANVPMNYWMNPKNIKQTLDWFLFQKLGFSSYEEALLNSKKGFLPISTDWVISNGIQSSIIQGATMDKITKHFMTI